MEHLDRDARADDGVLGEVGHAGAALAEQAQDPVAANGAADERHALGRRGGGRRLLPLARLLERERLDAGRLFALFYQLGQLGQLGRLL